VLKGALGEGESERMLEDRGESERQGEVTANEVETGTKRGLKKV
jgi:hypothetical protein